MLWQLGYQRFIYVTQLKQRLKVSFFGFQLYIRPPYLDIDNLHIYLHFRHLLSPSKLTYNILPPMDIDVFTLAGWGPLLRPTQKAFCILPQVDIDIFIFFAGA